MTTTVAEPHQQFNLREASEAKIARQIEEDAKPKKFRFKVLRGNHSEGIVTEGERRGKFRIYKQGDVVETNNDLSKHNRPGATKFSRLGQEGETLDDELQRLREENARLEKALSDNNVEVPLDPKGESDKAAVGEVVQGLGLDKLKKAELVQLAEENRIDIATCANVEEIRNTIAAELAAE